ncbi:unnamed protein product [Spirodela intermedia]|uniref:Uncharacterized protein n=1 Tax=Spirodela intermedia TaxID=51605 RepID=A0A7I8JAE0_SPIIN|nr:unnamed protein product [Spirodela intermedia]CAA6666961.1 unnamed protein product [Spirodela intermedia]
MKGCGAGTGAAPPAARRKKDADDCKKRGLKGGFPSYSSPVQPPAWGSSRGQPSAPLSSSAPPTDSTSSVFSPPAAASIPPAASTGRRTLTAPPITPLPPPPPYPQALFFFSSSSSSSGGGGGGGDVVPAHRLRHRGVGAALGKRKDYIKLWWRPGEMTGSVWLDKPVKTHRREAALLPTLRLSGDTSRFPYTHRGGRRSAVRISRIISETLRLPELPAEARWFIMGDDDTVFFPENLLRVLSKYDHRQPYYIGAVSESHLQNIFFSYGMAYGGGGFAVSRPLAEELAAMQDGCLSRYPALYGSDDRIQACMAELGVPLTREPGFHQYDVYGSLLGLLAAHPVAPLVSLHHLDVVEPVLPGRSRVAALKQLFDVPARLDAAALMQQSICYDGERRWTVAVAWGYVVQVEMPTRTFLNWYRREDYKAYAFNTRPVARNPCQKPFVFYLTSAAPTAPYPGERPHPLCRWKMAEPSAVKRVVVYKRVDPHLWDRAPRRNCCRVRRAGGERRRWRWRWASAGPERSVSPTGTAVKPLKSRFPYHMNAAGPRSPAAEAKEGRGVAVGVTQSPRQVWFDFFSSIFRIALM